MKTLINTLLRRDGAAHARLAIWPGAAALLASATLAWGASDAPPSTTSAAPAAPVKVAAPSVTFSSGSVEILKMQDAGIDGGVMKAYIERSPIVYRLSADEIIALLQRGVPSDIVVAMLYKSGEARTPRAPAPPTAAPYSPPVPVINYAYPAPAVYPDYGYADAFPSYAGYPSSSYVSLGFGCGWPYYSYGYGWPSYGYRYGGAWGGSRYCGPSRYSGPTHSGVVGRVGFGGSSHFSGGNPSGGRGGGPSHFSGGPSGGRGGGGSPRGR